MKCNTLLLCLSLIPATLAAQSVTNTPAAGKDPFSTEWKLKPALLHTTEGNLFNPAVRFDADARYDFVPNLGPKGFVEGRTAGTIALESRSHSDPTYAELSGGFTWNTFHLVSKAPAYHGPDDLNGSNVPMLDYQTFGRFDAGLKARFETDQRMENYNVAYGAVAGYVMSDKNGWRALVPSVVAAYDRVEILHSELYRKMGVNEDAFYRFSLSASWDYRIGELISKNRFVTPLGTGFDVRYYYSHDLPAAIRGAGFDESLYLAGTLSYELTDLKFSYLRQIFVTVAHGRQPPATKDATTVFVGLVIGPKLRGHSQAPNL